MKNTKYVLIKQDILFQQMSIAEKTVKKHGIIIDDSNPHLKELLNGEKYGEPKKPSIKMVESDEKQ